VNNDLNDTAFLADDTSFHTVEGGGVLFSAREGRLYALNPVAGLTWLCLKDGLSKPECTVAIANAFGVEDAIAAEWFGASMTLFKKFGLLHTSDGNGSDKKKSRFEPQIASALQRISSAGSRVWYKLFEQTVCVSAPVELQPIIDSLLKNLRIDPPQEEWPQALAIDIVRRSGAWDISVGGRQETNCATKSVAPEIERLVIQAIVPATSHLLAFHAAAVQRRDRTFLLAGNPGIGKTTLSLALKRAGWDFGSDEIVLLNHDLRLRPLPLPPCVKADTFSTIEPLFSELGTAPEHDRYGRRIKYLPLISAAFHGGEGVVVFPNYDPSSSNEIEILDGLVGLQRLLEQCVFVPSGFRHDDVNLLLQWHSLQQYVRIQYNDCDAAIALLTDRV
jgi:hypothetical protein